MNITNDYPVMIFKQEYQGKTFYSVGLSKKNQDGSYTNGYMPCQFKGNVNLEDKTKIYIKKAWLSFYLKDKTTKPYIFISEYETVREAIDNAKKEVDPFKEFGDNIKTETSIGQQIKIDDSELPF